MRHRNNGHDTGLVIDRVKRAVFAAAGGPHLVIRRIERLAEPARVAGQRAAYVLVQRGRGVQRQRSKAAPGGRGEGDRPRLVIHSPAVRRLARSLAICSAENTRPARASAKPSRRSRIRAVSDRTSIVSRSRSSSPEAQRPRRAHHGLRQRSSRRARRGAPARPTRARSDRRPRRSPAARSCLQCGPGRRSRPPAPMSRTTRR